MTAATDIVKRALNAIGAHSEVNAADPELLSVGLEQLIGLLEEHVADEIYYGSKLTSLTSVGTVATATLALHGFAAGSTVIIAGAHQGGYNGRVAVVAVPTVNTFTYAMAAAQDVTTATSQEAARGITALMIPAALAENPKEQRSVTTGLAYLLALRMGPLCRVPVPADVSAAARAGFAGIKARFQASSIPNLVPSRLLPRGQGSQRGPYASSRFGGEALDDDSPP